MFCNEVEGTEHQNFQPNIFDFGYIKNLTFNTYMPIIPRITAHGWLKVISERRPFVFASRTPAVLFLFGSGREMSKQVTKKGRDNNRSTRMMKLRLERSRKKSFLVG